ncbi:hypothetical protein [Flavihumibacter profundi]|jgi:hypothetical protein|uniref:hypothetical protein n=1 Tax=Flavihumibacter profundi TaxID=2716883 RepID=UPI001CC752FF|nr:hypothetical protein [Flavihumibacter profundi]MBZ5858186.1 hypothetical protein [Flavihumibacter profundi]
MLMRVTLLIILGGITACGRDIAEQTPFKDLSEQMDVLAILQGSIGTDIAAGDWQSAYEMTVSMDSVFSKLSDDFPKHQRLNKPFSEYYAVKLDKTVGELLKSIKSRDSLAAVKGYQLLVKRCNSCHNDNEVAERAHL